VACRPSGCAAGGPGHLTRCRSLADALRRAGAHVGFVLGEPSASTAASLRANGYDVEVVPCASLDALDEPDAAATVGACDAWGAAALVVDHYGASSRYFERIATTGLLVGAIDELGDRDLHAVRWILNQNLGARDSLYDGAAGRTLLLGPSYALLRPQFAEERARLDRTFSTTDRRVLITFGGSAPATLYAAAIAALNRVERRLELRVVTGAPGAAGLVRAAASTSRHAVEVLGRVEAMAAAIVWADVVVTAGGSTCWELLALGTPLAAASLSRDQVPNVAALAGHDLGVPFEADGLVGLPESVVGLLTDTERRREMSERGRALVDGRGADRGAGSLLSAIGSEVHRAAA
jgi:UDP-2,4-diacetamido-2,4,6-trideoxy-beta-L-altropyranose hydrolase